MDPERAALEAVLAHTLESQALWRLREEVIRSAGGLASLLRHACRTVPYFQAQSIADDSPSLDRFPMTSRSLVGSQRLAFMSSVARADESPLFARTSGSTGHPLTVRFGPAEWYELTQASYGRIAESFPLLSELARPGELSVAMIHDGANRQTTSVVLFDLNFSVFSRFVTRGEAGADAEVVRALRAATVPMLYGKPAYLLKLARLDASLDRDSERIRPGMLFTSGENLYRDQREELETSYRCRVVNAYTSVEGGLIGLQCPAGETLHVDSTRSLLEVSTADGRIAAEGEGELILTNLWNWTMPFIRYRTGDYGVVGSQACECGHRGQSIVRLDGREVGRFDTGSASVETCDLDTLFAGLGVQQFQIAQQSVGALEVTWVPREPQRNTFVERELAARIRERMGDDVRITVHQVAAITKRDFKTRRYLSPSRGRSVVKLEPLQPKELHAPRRQDSLCALSAAAERLAIAHDEGLDVVDLGEGTDRHRIETLGASTTALQFSPTDAIVAFGGSSGAVRLWNAAGAGHPIATFEIAATPSVLSFSFDGIILVVGGSDGSLHAWPLTGDTAASVAPGLRAVTALAPSSVCRLLAVARRDGTAIELRSLPDLEILGEIETAGTVTAMAFMLDENVLAAGYEDGRLELWNADTHEPVAGFRHSDAVTAVAFCQSTQTLVAGSGRGEVRLWDVWRGREKAVLRAHASAVCGIVFRSDGRGYVTVARDASVKQWPWET